MVNPVGKEKPLVSHNLVKYDFDMLKKRGGIASNIGIGETIADVEKRRVGNGLKPVRTSEIIFESDGN